MAIVDLNSRYGTYADDAAIGGYNRKELRGLSKQARRGTLTQRERARLKYLTDERKGRRRRGLLSGLGGAAATLGGLALAGKLGKGEGGEGRGAALMDAIKARIDDKRKARADELGEKGEGSMEEMMVPKPENVREERGLMGGEREEPMSEDDLVRRANEGGDPLRMSTSDVMSQGPTQNIADFITDEGPIRGEGAVPGPEGRSDTPGSHVEEARKIAREIAMKRAEDDSFEDEDQDVFDLSVSDMLEAGLTPEEIGASKGRGAYMQPAQPRQPSEIPTKRLRLEALEKLRKFFGNRYN